MECLLINAYAIELYPAQAASRAASGTQPLGLARRTAYPF
jgi:hypothetical protein